MSGDSSPTEIEFVATVYKVQTLVDNGIRVTLDLAEGETLTMAKLAECQRFGVGLKVVVAANRTESNDETKESATGSPDRVGRRRITKRRD